MSTTVLNSSALVKCRECDHQVSKSAVVCPGCGTPWPVRQGSRGWEYKSKATVFGFPLVHISFKYRRTESGVPVPVVARGVVSIGQFGVGIVNISQFGIGVFSLSQFTIARYAIAQFAIARYALCQLGIVEDGLGQQLLFLKDLLGM